MVVAELLKEHGITEPPVPVRKLARTEGAKSVLNALASDLSGFLFRDGEQTVIGVNTHHAKVRQTFTVAHELAHLILHKNIEPLHVDRRFLFRSAESAKGTDPLETEANKFAAELLMPEAFLRKDWARLTDLDFADEEVLPDLARRYGVSMQALQFRLLNLGLISATHE